jgi:hypothetical protein
MTEYYGDWSANNGSTYCAEPYTDTNKKRLARDMREIAKGETYEGNVGYWRVYVLGDDEPIVILEGMVR